MFSETRYALNGDLRVAYRASREGPRDIVFVPNWFTCCDLLPELPSVQGWVEAMTIARSTDLLRPAGHRSVRSGSHSGALPTLEQWADSITAVLDDLGSREAVLVAVDGAFATAALFAATHPSRTTALVALEGVRGSGCERTMGSSTRGILRCHGRHVGHRGIQTRDQPGHAVERGDPGSVGAAWNAWRRARATVALMMPLLLRIGRAGVASDDPRANPGRPITPTIRSSRPRGAATSLITYRARNTLSCRGATCTTSWNRGASRFRRSPSSSPVSSPTWPTIGYSPRCCSPTSWTRRAAPRRWATVTGMRCSMRMTPSSGRSLARFRGREVNTSGDGFLAMFDGPQRAIRCAMAIRDAVQALGIEVRAGLHTGECEVRGDDIGGIAVHIGARVSALAGPNEVLVSSTLRDLVIGSGLEFDDRGAHALKGVPGDWHLFAVASR